MVSAAWTVQAMPIAAMLAESVKALIKLRRFIVRSPWTYEFFSVADANAEGAFARDVPGREKALKCGGWQRERKMTMHHQ
jgi:hypothetical protein